MNCKDIDLYACLYIDNMVSEKEKIEFEKHISTCKNCKIVLDNLNMIVESIDEIGEVQLPENFSNELMEKLEAEKDHKSKKKLPNKIKLLTSIAAGLLITVMSLSLLDSYLIDPNKGEELDIAKVEENSNIEESYELKTYGKESTKDSLEDPGVEPRIMSIESIDEEENLENQESEENQQNQDDQTDNLNQSEEEKKTNINKPFIVSILTLGIGLLIYKIWKK